MMSICVWDKYQYIDIIIPKFDLNIHTDLQEAEWLILSTKKDKVKNESAK